jgi:hypothetical protein
MLKKYFTILLLSVSSQQLLGQVLALENIRLKKIENNVWDFKVSDKRAYRLVRELTTECDSFTMIPNESLGDNALLGYLFNFKNYTVVYVLLKNNGVRGSLIKNTN